MMKSINAINNNNNKQLTTQNQKKIFGFHVENQNSKIKQQSNRIVLVLVIVRREGFRFDEFKPY